MPLIQNLREHEKYQVWRKRHRIRLLDVANYCGCSVAALSLFENGELRVSDELLAYYDEFVEKFQKGIIKR